MKILFDVGVYFLLLGVLLTTMSILINLLPEFVLRRWFTRFPNPTNLLLNIGSLFLGLFALVAISYKVLKWMGY